MIIFNWQIIKHALLLLFLLFIFTKTGSNAYAYYIPPVGIPAPSFGIDEQTYNPITHCPNWPSSVNSKVNGQFYDCYYVDNSSMIATDTANPYGYPNKPRLTLPTGLLTAGAYIDIRGGVTIPYTAGSDRFRFYGAGTAVDYILISGRNAATNPILNNFVCVGCHSPTNVSYIIVEGITVNTTFGGFDVRPENTTPSMDHIAIRNCKTDGLVGGKVTNGGGQTFNAYGTSNVSLSDIVFYNNRVEHAGNWQPAVIDEAIGFHVGSYVTRMWMVDNSTWRTGNTGYGHGHGANGTTRYVYVGRNSCSESGKTCADFKEVRDLIISENTFHNPGPIGTGGSGQCIITHYGPDIGPDTSWIIFNKLYDCDVGIQTANYSGDTYIIGNIIYNIWQRCADTSTTPWTIYASGSANCKIGHGNTRDDLTSAYSRGTSILSYQQTGNVHIVDNTFYDYEKAIAFDNANLNQNASIYGNIFSGRNQSLGQEIHANYPNRTMIDHNLFHNVDNIRILWGGILYTNVMGFKNTVGKCAQCIEGDPLFVNPPVDFSLQTDSLALNNNVQHSLYGVFNAVYSLGIQKDFIGTPRPQGLAFDIGAYEYISSSTPPPPTPLKGDFNSDSKVNNLDFTSFKNAFKSIFNSLFDLNSDSTIDVKDLGVLMSSWLE